MKRRYGIFSRKTKKESKILEKVSKRPIILYLFAMLISFLAIIVITVFCIFYVPFKPFIELRNLYIGTAMTTYNHQWMAKLFFSDETIE